jgi:class 3 adenylate cyclase/tetratricopeptide (TPR) repeat protein
MRCPSCRHETLPDAKFCPECGTRLGSARSTPGHLVAHALRSRTALEGERKQVTVLFADLKNSMELLAGRDAEAARGILDPVLQLMMDAVHHYEGTVNQVMGDGIMALFGAPIAHEDHAVRACYAALRMQEHARRYAADVRRSLDVEIGIRVGLNSGDVVVRSIGNDLQMDYTAVGQTTHLAARMEDMAAPGSILATASTARAAEGYVEIAPLGSRPVKGMEEALEIYEIRGTGAVRWALEQAAARGLTAFVGREAEVAQLRHTARIAADGHGQVVAIIGEPGVGKSRLLHEVTRPESLPGWRVLKTAAVSYGKATAHRPLVELLRGYFGLDAHAGHDVVRQTIAGFLGPSGTPRIQSTAEVLALFEVPVDDPRWQALDPRQRHQRTMDAVRRLLLREGQEQPLCLVFENLQWIDSETQAFLDSLVESVPPARLLLLVSYRPEYRHEWGAKSYYAQLSLDPLPHGDAEELLQALLGTDPALAALRSLLIARTEGNPFFLEECVRMLADEGTLAGARGSYRLAKPVQTIRMPDTVQAVLAARVDRLEPDDKRLLQCAAVIGDHVRAGLLEAVADMPPAEIHDRLRRLRAAEFLYDEDLFPERQHVFRHGLMREVAYDSVLRDRRRALHARVVEALERLYPDHLGEHLESLAHHARQGELWERASRYLRQAGTKAFESSSNRQAVAWFEQALEVVARLDETRATLTDTVDLHLGLRNALTLLGEHGRSLEHLLRAESIAERLGDSERLGRTLSFEVNALLLLGRHDRAIEVADRARAVAEARGDVPLRTVVDIYAGRAHLNLGDFARAIDLFGGVVAALVGSLAHDHLGIPVLPSVFARSHLVEALAEVGRFEESARHAADAIALARTTDHPDTLLWAYHGAGVHHLVRGEAEAAATALERALAVSREYDMPVYRPRISAELGLAWSLAGRGPEAEQLVRHALEEAARRGQAVSSTQVLLLLAASHLRAERLDEAAEAATSALTQARRQRARGHEAHALRLLGDIGAAGPAVDLDRAEACYAESATLADKLGMRPLRARCDAGRARLLLRAGRADRARDALTSACALFRELGMSADLADAEARLGSAG